MVERHVSACLIGPGAEKSFDMTGLAKACQEKDVQVVLDGDALGEVPNEYAAIITPHDGEFKRMFPDLAELPNKLERAKKAAVQASCVVVLKGIGSIHPTQLVISCITFQQLFPILSICAYFNPLYSLSSNSSIK